MAHSRESSLYTISSQMPRSSATTALNSKHDPYLLEARALTLLNQLCQCGGSMRLSAISDDPNTFFQLDPIAFLKRFPYFFRLESLDVDCRVHAYTRAQLCQEEGKKAGCGNPHCEKLHLCKHFVTGKCKFGDNCTQKHNLRLPHNEEVLAIHHLNSLEDRMIQLILKQSLVEYTVPDICSHYNSMNGCNKAMKCNFVHVCLHYVEDDCRFTNSKRESCRYSHNIREAQPMRVLTKFNIDINQSPQELVKILRFKRSCASEGVTSAAEGENTDHLETEFAKKASVVSKKPSGVSRRSPHHSGSNRPRERHLSSAQSDEAYICVFHLRGKCNYEEKCRSIHSEEPYQWRYQSPTSMQWENFLQVTNRQIERAYCDVAEDSVTILKADDINTGVHNPDGVIDLDKMQLMVSGQGGQLLDIKRVAASANIQGWRKCYATQWLWHWKDEHGVWTGYGKINTKGMKSDINSCSLEEAYQNYLKEDGSGSRYLDFQTDYHEYRLDLETKQQKNIRYKTERQLRRRPVLMTKEALNDRAERLESQSNFSVPENWDLYAKSGEAHSNFQLCPVGEATDEYVKVFQRFSKTMPNVCYHVETIVRIQNIDLWEDYSRKKERMEKKCGGKKIREELLFHGTKQEVVEAICQQNFDWRLSGTRVGALYGQGSYFHNEASYSNKYAKPNRGKNQFMFVARVLVGSFTAGEKDMRKPPPKNPEKPHLDLYDTCVDRADDPNIFVVFENNQVYPEYLIKYQAK